MCGFYPLTKHKGNFKIGDHCQAHSVWKVKDNWLKGQNNVLECDDMWVSSIKIQLNVFDKYKTKSGL